MRKEGRGKNENNKNNYNYTLSKPQDTNSKKQLNPKRNRRK